MAPEANRLSMFHVKRSSLSTGCAWGHEMTKSTSVCGETGGRRGCRSDSLTCVSTPSLAALPIRRLTLRDLTVCADLSQDRGWPREEHKWGFLLTAGKGFGIDDPQGGLVAACVVTEYGPWGRPDLAAIGMVLVAGRHARQGIGRRLMRHVLSTTGTTPLTLHATPNGRPLYEELGFKVTGRAEMLKGRFTPGGTESGVFTRAAAAEDLPAILRLDEEVFGADRTPLITRLPAFADQLRVAEEDGRIIGYAAAWPNMDTHVVGPLVARDTETAKALVGSLAAHTDRPLRTDIDVRHEELLTWAKARGLASVAFNAVMTYGTTDLPGDWTRRFAPLTVAAG
jgi:GNAT superfamily N-acetyltransferase